jgi:phenylalanine-4-hydroxylase
MKNCHYQSKSANANGIINWTEQEDLIWHDLLKRQLVLLQEYACDQYLSGLDYLNLPNDRIPQVNELNQKLQASSGWQVTPVPALIPFETFFKLLAERQFPIATFIRHREEFDYLQEPDIFHEIVGHCPLLTDPSFAKFTHKYGQLGAAADPQQRVFLARLYWFTVEFGLVRSQHGLRIYGGGILSSPAETEYALHSNKPERRPFSLLDVMRTPYRIDIMQPIYYVIDDLIDLLAIAKLDLMAQVKKAQQLGLYPARYSLDSEPSKT